MAQVPPSESRQAERIHARFPVTLLLSSEAYAVAWPASTTEVSAQGARILTGAVLGPGQMVVMRSRYIGTPPVLARVVWVSGRPAEPTHAGLEFLN